MAAISKFSTRTNDVRSDVKINPEDKKSERPLALAYRINDLAKAVGVGRTTIYKLIAQGKIRPIKIAGRVLIPAEEIERLLTESGAFK